MTTTDGAPRAGVTAPRAAVAVAVLAVGVIGATIHVAAPLGVPGALSYLVTAVCATVLAAVSVVGRTATDRSAWVAVACGLACSAVGNATYYVLTWSGSVVPGVSVCDPWWLGSYGFLIVGASRLAPDRRRWFTLNVDALIDTAALAAIGAFTAWLLFIVPSPGNEAVALPSRVVSAAYPLLDVVLLFHVLCAMIDRRHRGAAPRLLGVGIGLWLLSDVASTIERQDAGQGVRSLLDAGWMLGATAMAVAAWLPAGDVMAARPVPDQGRWHVRDVGWIIVALFVPSVADAIADARGLEPQPAVGLTVTVVLAALVLVRSVRLLRARNEARARLLRNESFYRTLTASSSDAVIVVDEDGRILHDSPTLHELLDQPSTDAAGSWAVDIIDPREPRVLCDLLGRSLTSPAEVLQADLAVGDRASPARWLHARVVNRLDDPVVGGIVVTLQDATERRRVADGLRRQALHDPLTGLANRALFRDRLEQALRGTDRSGRPPAVIFLDVDDFKKVNDSLGHEVGDAVLITLGERITRSVRSQDTVARLGGDEFAILVESSASPVADAQATAERVIEALGAPVVVGDREITLAASLGIDVGSPTSDAAVLLRNADIAMYRAKGTGKGRWVVYEPTMRALALERMDLEIDLVGARESGQLRLMYQPVVELATGRVVGLEALLRWDHPTHGPLSPDTFVPIAEETGLINEIGEWALREACCAVAGWHERYPEHPAYAAVNVSGVQLVDPCLVDQVADALMASGLSANRLVLELTETVLVSDPAGAARRLDELRGLGVKIAIDDFGTGYSSLTYLRQFSVDILKIDRSFVTGISEQAGLPALIRGLLDLGRTLDLDVVAEGIEAGDQLQRLLEGGCVHGQGFFFAPPLGAGDIEALMAGTSSGQGIADVGPLMSDDGCRRACHLTAVAEVRAGSTITR